MLKNPYTKLLDIDLVHICVENLKTAKDGFDSLKGLERTLSKNVQWYKKLLSINSGPNTVKADDVNNLKTVSERLSVMGCPVKDTLILLWNNICHQIISEYSRRKKCKKEKSYR